MPKPKKPAASAATTAATDAEKQREKDLHTVKPFNGKGPLDPVTFADLIALGHLDHDGTPTE